MAKLKNPVLTGDEAPEPTEHDKAVSEMPPEEASALFPDVKAINDILAAHEITGGSVRIEVKRPTDTRFNYLVKIPVEQFDLDWVKNTYGGGDYLCRTFRANGQMYKKFEFSIDARIKGSIDQSSGQAAPPQQGMAQMAQVLSAMRGGEEASQNMMLKLMQDSAQRQSETTTLLMTMMMESNKTMVATMTAAMQAIGGGQRGGTQELMLPVLLEMVKSRDKTDISGMISAIKELKGLTDGEKAAEQKEPEDMFDKVAKYAGPLLTALVTRTPIPMPGTVVEAPQPQPSQPVALPAPTKPSGVNPMLEVKAYADMLISSARRNVAVEPIATMVVDQLDDQQLDGLLDLLVQPNWIELLAKDEPRIKDHPVWFGKLRDAIINMTTEPEAEGGDTPPPDDTERLPDPNA